MLELQQLFELLDRQARVLNDAAHRKRVHGIVSWYGDNSLAVSHDDVLAFARYPKARSLQGTYGVAMIHARQLGHVSERPQPRERLLLSAVHLEPRGTREWRLECW